MPSKSFEEITQDYKKRMNELQKDHDELGQAIAKSIFRLVKDMKNEHALNKDFDNQFGKENRQGNKREFPSAEKAMEFYESQAKQGREFSVKKENADFHVYSNGSGTLFSGTHKEYEQYMKNPNSINVEHENQTPHHSIK